MDLAAAISELRNRPIPPAQKGFGAITAAGEVSVADLAGQRPSLFGGRFTMPLLLLREPALEHNARAMAHWCARAGVLLAPHGKTTMAPQLLARQLAAGAWGVTAATISQVQAYRAYGAGRVLIANELTDQAGIGWLAAELAADPGFECFVYADSVAGVRLLDDALVAGGAAGAPGSRLRVLAELGYPGGRTGCRTVAQALDVAAAIGQASCLTLAGVAGYEGGIGNDAGQATLDKVAAYCAQLGALAGQLPGEPPAGGWIVSAGGSAFFDVVVRELAGPPPGGGPARTTLVLRSGCYLTQDHGEYAHLTPGVARGGPDLVPAIELWAPVLSRPEPGLALACAGRRDVSFDQGMPVPLRVRRADGALTPAGELAVTRLDDQHAYLSVPAGYELAPGDLIGMGISHPCTCLDKWRLIPVVDDDYRLTDAIYTFF